MSEKHAISQAQGKSIPVKINVLERPIQEGFDLDLLWGEFLVAGNTRAVVRAIDVLEWPDRVRERLHGWMRSNASSLSEADRRQIEQQLQTMGVLCDFCRHEIKNAEDLDCLSVLQQGAVSRDRVEEVKKVLPFVLSDQDLNHMTAKGATTLSATAGRQQAR